MLNVKTAHERKLAPPNAAAAGILFAPPPPITAGRRAAAADQNHPARRRRQNIIGAGVWSYPLNILNASMRSPLFLLSSRVVSFSFRKRWL